VLLQALRTVNGQMTREVEQLKQRLAHDEAEKQQANRLTELQNKTVVIVSHTPAHCRRLAL
jgi:phosphohistidine phosphatase SixA